MQILQVIHEKLRSVTPQGFQQRMSFIDLFTDDLPLSVVLQAYPEAFNNLDPNHEHLFSLSQYTRLFLQQTIVSQDKIPDETIQEVAENASKALQVDGIPQRVVDEQLKIVELLAGRRVDIDQNVVLPMVDFLI